MTEPEGGRHKPFSSRARVGLFRAPAEPAGGKGHSMSGSRFSFSPRPRKPTLAERVWKRVSRLKIELATFSHEDECGNERERTVCEFTIMGEIMDCTPDENPSNARLVRDMLREFLPSRGSRREGGE